MKNKTKQNINCLRWAWGARYFSVLLFLSHKDFVVLFVSSFQDRLSVCSPGWAGTGHEDQASFGLTETYLPLLLEFKGIKGAQYYPQQSHRFLKNLFLFFVIICRCVHLHVGMCTCMQCLWRPEAFDPLELELEKVVRTQVLWESRKSSQPRSHLSSQSHTDTKL